MAVPIARFHLQVLSLKTSKRAHWVCGFGRLFPTLQHFRQRQVFDVHRLSSTFVHLSVCYPQDKVKSALSIVQGEKICQSI